MTVCVIVSFLLQCTRMNVHFWYESRPDARKSAKGCMVNILVGGEHRVSATMTGIYDHSTTVDTDSI